MVEQAVQPQGGSPNLAPPLQFYLKGDDNLVIREISLKTAAVFVAEHHYSKVMPKLNKVVFGLFRQDSLVGCITFGWGVRPLDTIKKLFPSLISKDYLEIGKLCLLDEMPKNSESRFIAAAMKFLHRIRPDLKLVFTWADAIWGKPGYIYQAANFLFGGEIESEAYRSREGLRMHPRQLNKYIVKFCGESKGRYVSPEEVRDKPELGVGNWAAKNTSSGVRRPFPSDMKRLGLSHVRGLQFRYVYFLCPDKEKQTLLAESYVLWHRDYPKLEDCKWRIKIEDEKGYHEWNPLPLNQPVFTGAFDMISMTKPDKNSARLTRKSKN